MKAILALGAAAALSGCAYYDPYVYDTPYYGAPPGYYGNAPYGVMTQPYYYGYDYPNTFYPAYPWVGPHTRPRPDGVRPDGHAARPDGRGPGHRPSRPDRGSGGGDRTPGGSLGGGGSGGSLGGSGADVGPSGGGSGGDLIQLPAR